MRRRWFSRRAIGLHAVILVIVPTFSGLCIWQVHRALAGNELSWAYVFEWPFFAGYAVYMWWRFIHEAPLDSGDAHPSPEPSEGAASEARPVAGDAGPDPDAEDLAAYNNYLAELAAHDERTQSG
jgi:hypothetical protein